MKLYAGYFVGEFGWELMRWQGFVRHVAKSYDYVVVGCEEGHEYLYEDFASEFVIFDKKPYMRNMWFYDRGCIPRMQFKDGDTIYPSKELCLSNHLHQDFIKYGNSLKSKKPIIVIHARSTTNYNTGYRNWDIKKWEILVGNLINYYSTDCDIYSIGTEAHHIMGTLDFRNKPLEEVCDLLSITKACIGPSSGPMHLASLCECPVLVWTDSKMEYTINGTNRDRYERLWNPFCVKNVVVDDMGWQPKVEVVWEKLRQLL